jgi:hypothetical protein
MCVAARQVPDVWVLNLRLLRLRLLHGLRYQTRRVQAEYEIPDGPTLARAKHTLVRSNSGPR